MSGRSIWMDGSDDIYHVDVKSSKMKHACPSECVLIHLIQPLCYLAVSPIGSCSLYFDNQLNREMFF